LKNLNNIESFNNLFAINRLKILKEELDEMMLAKNILQAKIELFMFIDGLDNKLLDDLGFEKETGDYQYHLQQKSEEMTVILAKQDELLNKMNILNTIFKEVRLELEN